MLLPQLLTSRRQRCGSVVTQNLNDWPSSSLWHMYLLQVAEALGQQLPCPKPDQSVRKARPSQSSASSWSTPRDQMHLVHSISVLVRIVTNNGWHTQPFKDTPNAPTLTFECRELFPTPGTTRRSADKAGPQIQTPSLPPAHCAPSDTTACPSCDQCGPLPSQPPQSDRCPPPPGPLSRKSYADTVRDVMALVNLAKTMPDLPSDHILAMHKASLPPPSNKCWINSMTSGPPGIRSSSGWIPFPLGPNSL
jgi:hypothetical protein